MNNPLATKQNYQDKLKFLRSVSQANQPVAAPKLESREHSIDAILGKLKKFDDKLTISIVPNPYANDLTSHAIQTMPELLNYEVAENESVDIQKWKDEIDALNKEIGYNKENTLTNTNTDKHIELRDVSYFKIHMEAMSIKSTELLSKLSTAQVFIQAKIPTVKKSSINSTYEFLKVGCPPPSNERVISEIKNSSNYHLSINDSNLNSFITSDITFDLLNGNSAIGSGKLSMQKIMMCKQFKYDGVVKIFDLPTLDTVPHKLPKKDESPAKNKKGAKPKKQPKKEEPNVAKKEFIPTVIAELRVIVQMGMDDEIIKVEAEKIKEVPQNTEKMEKEKSKHELEKPVNQMPSIKLVLYLFLHGAKDVLLRKVDDHQIFRNLYSSYKSPIGIRVDTPISWGSANPEFHHEAQYNLENITIDTAKKYQCVLFEFWDRITEGNEELLGTTKISIEQFWSTLFSGNFNTNIAWQTFTTNTYPYVLVDGCAPIYSFKLKGSVGQSILTVAVGTSDQIFKFKELMKKNHPQPASNQIPTEKNEQTANEETKETPIDKEKQAETEDAEVLHDDKQFSFMTKEKSNEKQNVEQKPLESLNEIENIATMLNAQNKEEDGDPTPERNIPIPSNIRSTTPVEEKKGDTYEAPTAPLENVTPIDNSTPIENSKSPYILQNNDTQNHASTEKVQAQENPIMMPIIEPIIENNNEDKIVKPIVESGHKATNEIKESKAEPIVTEGIIPPAKETNMIKHIISIELVEMFEFPILTKLISNKFGEDAFFNPISYVGVKYSLPFDNKTVESDIIKPSNTVKGITFSIGLVSKHCCILGKNANISEKLGKEPFKISVFLRDSQPCCIGNALIASENIESIIKNGGTLDTILVLYGTPACQSDKGDIGKIRAILHYSTESIYRDNAPIIEKESEFNRQLPINGVLQFKIESLKHFKAPPINNSTLGISYALRMSPFYESTEVTELIQPMYSNKCSRISELIKESRLKFNLTLTEQILDYFQHKKALLELLSYSQNNEEEQVQGKICIGLISILTNPGSNLEEYDLINRYNEIIGEMSISIIYQKADVSISNENENQREIEADILTSPIIRVSPYKSTEETQLKQTGESTCMKIVIEEGIRINYFQQLNSFVEVELPFNTLNKPPICEVVANSTNPIWHYLYEAYFVINDDNLKSMISKPIMVRVYANQENNGIKECIGYSEIDISNFLLIDNWNCIEGYYHIKPTSKQYSEFDAIGQMRVKIISVINLRSKKGDHFPSAEESNTEVLKYDEEIKEETIQQVLHTLEEVKEDNPFMEHQAQSEHTDAKECIDEKEEDVTDQELRQRSMKSIQELQNMAIQMSISKSVHNSPEQREDIIYKSNIKGNELADNNDINLRGSAQIAPAEMQEPKQSPSFSNIEQITVTPMTQANEIKDAINATKATLPATNEPEKHTELKDVKPIPLGFMTTPSKRSSSIPDQRRSVEKNTLIESIKKKPIVKNMLPPKNMNAVNGQIAEIKRITEIMRQQKGKKTNAGDLSSDSDN